MLEYIFVFVFISIFALTLEDIKYKYNFFSYSLIFILFTILQFFRDFSIGVDTLNYVIFFDKISHSNGLHEVGLIADSLNIELGFSYLVYFFSLLGFSERGILNLFVSIIFFNLMFFSKKVSISSFIFFISILSYLNIYISSFNILRQIVAMSFLILSTAYLIKNRYIMSLFLILVSSLFHASSLLGFIFFLIYKFREELSRNYILVVSLVFVFLMSLNNVLTLFNKYSVYIESDTVTSSPKFFVIFSLMLLILSVFFKKKINFKNIDFYNFAIVLLSISVGLQFYQVFSSTLNQGISRLNLYFFWSSSILIMILINNFSKGEKKILIYSLFFIFMFAYYIYVLNNIGYSYVPYRKV